MISVISHILFNDLQKDVKVYETNLKKYTNSFHKVLAKSHNMYFNFVRSILFEDIGEDLLYYEPYSINLESYLSMNDYKKIEYTDYPFVNPNSFFSVLPSEDKVVRNLSNSFEFLDKTYHIHYKDNEFFFVRNNSVFLNFKLESRFKISYAGIDKNLFLSMIVETIDNGAPISYYIKTHLSYDFFEYDYENIPVTKLEDMECIHFIKIPSFVNGKPFFIPSQVNILGADFSSLYFNVGPQVFKILFSKRCYFVKDGMIFRTLRPEEAKHPMLDKNKVIRTEHCYFYDIIDIFGFNELKDQALITTYDALHFKNYKFDFGNHLNGLYNYFNFRIRKDYFLDIEKTFFRISGNFNFEHKLGSYELQIDHYDDKSCFAKLYLDKVLVDETELFFYEGVAYYKNVRVFKKFQKASNHVNDVFEFVVSDEYEYFMDFVEFNEDYDAMKMNKIDPEDKIFNLNNKVFRNDKENFKKETATLLPIKGNIYINDFIIDEYSRSGTGYTEISLLDEDNNITSLWTALSNKTHALINDFSVSTKKILVNENQNNVFMLSSKNFELDLPEIFKSLKA